MDYRSWEEQVPLEIKNDSLWNVKAYRLSLFLGELGWHDINQLMQDRQTIALYEQLSRSLGSISANIAEGYSRSSSKEKARFYEYSLGSARESRDWYFKCQYVLGEKVLKHRLSLITEIIRLLLTMIPNQRNRALREQSLSYEYEPINGDRIDPLLGSIPLPES